MERLAYSVKEAAAMLGVSEKTVRGMIDAGDLRVRRVYTARGRGVNPVIRIPRAALEEWLAGEGRPKRKGGNRR